MGKSTKAKQEKAATSEYAWVRALNVEKAAKAHKDKAKQSIDPVKLIVYQLSPYRSYFLKDPTKCELRTKSKDLDKQTLEIARQLLAKYPVCKPLTSVWNYGTPALSSTQPGRKCIAHGIDFTRWYICVAQGGSLYKEHAKSLLTKKEVHCLVTCPHELGLNEALHYSIARAECGNEGISLRISKSKIVTLPFDDFWKSVTRFFAKNPPVSIAEINDLLDYIMAMHNEQLRPGQYPFTMAGQTLEGLIKKKIDWHYALRRVKVMGNESWEGRFMPDKIFETLATDGSKDVVYWKFHQIKNAKELAAEGNRMHHCVFSYKTKCVKGDVSIWAVSKQQSDFGIEKQHVTIELNNYGTIVQARGFANRELRPEEASMVKKWANEFGLTSRYY